MAHQHPFYRTSDQWLNQLKHSEIFLISRLSRETHNILHQNQHLFHNITFELPHRLGLGARQWNDDGVYWVSECHNAAIRSCISFAGHHLQSLRIVGRVDLIALRGLRNQPLLQRIDIEHSSISISALADLLFNDDNESDPSNLPMFKTIKFEGNPIKSRSKPPTTPDACRYAKQQVEDGLRSRLLAHGVIIDHPNCLRCSNILTKTITNDFKFYKKVPTKCGTSTCVNFGKVHCADCTVEAMCDIARVPEETKFTQCLTCHKYQCTLCNPDGWVGGGKYSSCSECCEQDGAESCKLVVCRDCSRTNGYQQCTKCINWYCKHHVQQIINGTDLWEGTRFKGEMICGKYGCENIEGKWM